MCRFSCMGQITANLILADILVFIGKWDYMLIAVLPLKPAYIHSAPVNPCRGPCLKPAQRHPHLFKPLTQPC